MDNQLLQVFKTYATRRLFWAAVVAAILMHGLTISGNSGWPHLPAREQLVRQLTTYFLLPSIVNILLGMMVAGHLRMQFANPRARLMPHFAAAHLLVAAAILTIGVAANAWLFWNQGCSRYAWPILCYVVLATGVAVWGSHVSGSKSGPLMCLSLIMANGMAISRVIPLAIAGNALVFWGLAGIGLVALAALGTRLVLFHEKDGQAMVHIWIGWFWFHDLKFRLIHRSIDTMGPLRRMLLRELCGGPSSVSIALGISIFWLVLFSLMSYWLGYDVPNPDTSFWPFFWFYFAILLVFGTASQRRPHLMRESLFPQRRVEFFRDIARRIGCAMSILAIGYYATVVIISVLTGKQFDALTTHTMVHFGMIAAQYLLGTSLLFGLLVFRRRLLGFLGVVVYAILSSIVVAGATYAWQWFWSPMHLAVAMLAAAAMAYGLYRLALRRWLRTDLA